MVQQQRGIYDHFPFESDSKVLSTGWGFFYGAGINFNKYHSVIREVMWNSLPLTDSSIDGHGNLVSVTGNYRAGFERRTYGMYFIVGAGLYYRDPSGTVAADQGSASLSSTVAGGNVGIGITFRIPDSEHQLLH